MNKKKSKHALFVKSAQIVDDQSLSSDSQECQDCQECTDCQEWHFSLGANRYSISGSYNSGQGTVPFLLIADEQFKVHTKIPELAAKLRGCITECHK